MRSGAGRVRLSALACALAAALALGGCGLGAGPAPSAIELLVTRDFGAQVLYRSGAPKLAGQETVMSLLERNQRVTTRYGGGFVQSIDGLAGGREAGRPVDWFYFVNGLEAPRGAAATNVHPGDHIWWDRHDWSEAMEVPAVVGSFPEPFVNGLNGRRWPVLVECATVSNPACGTVAARLRGVGVPAAIAAIGSGSAPETLRVLVGPWASIAHETGPERIEQGPRSSGVYARFSAGGGALVLLAADGLPAQTLAAPAGLIAATREGEDAPVWLVTGTDAAGVQLAARAFDREALEDRFAVALSPTETIPVPAGGS